jgi:sigma-B regulation protein RsbU (phosphoserine phosphatase)
MTQTEAQAAAPVHVDSLLLEVADVVNTTLDLDTILRRVAELVRRVIAYEHFAILLLNERTQEMRIRFSVGHPPDIVERCRIRVGEGVTGLAAQRREAVLVNDVQKVTNYIEALPEVRSELAVPLIIKNRVIGVIDIEAPQPGYFTEQHQRLLSLIASRIAIGIENARLYTRVARQARSLAVLNEVSREVSSILNLDELLQRISELLRRLIDYQMFSILLVDDTGTKLVHRFSVKFNEKIRLKHDIPLDKGLCGYAASNKVPVLVGDVRKDPRYISTNAETRSELCVPLVYKDAVIGVLDIEHTRRNYFTDDHQRTISTLAAQVAVAIENARLYERVRRQEQRLQKDLELARELQMRLLPPSCPVLGRAQVAAKFVPARQIGGDLYDFLQYDKDGLGIAIGDVSGKGAPAALYAALTSGFLRSLSAEQPAPADMLARLNDALVQRQIEGQFVCVAYAVFDEKRHCLRVANSGLPRPMYCHNGRLERMEAIGLPLGLFHSAEYDEVTYRVQAGDVFVFFSDGMLDARNRAGELFGRGRIEQIVENTCGGSAQDIVAAIFHAVAEFSAGEPPFDDQTVVVLKIAPATGKRAPCK